ncbi:MAG: hypothetical protein H0Z37_10990 [Firmicutes bacterium]|nr:hypothetical protein [Bacillota bacterium]
MVFGPIYRAIGNVMAEHMAAWGWTPPRTHLSVAWRKLRQGDIDCALDFAERFIWAMLDEPDWQAARRAYEATGDPHDWLRRAAAAYRRRRREMDELLVLVEALKEELRTQPAGFEPDSRRWQRLRDMGAAVGVAVTPDAVYSPEETRQRLEEPRVS